MPEMSNGQTVITSNAELSTRKPAAHAPEHALEMDLPKISTGGMVAVAGALALLLAGVFLLGWIPHSRREAETERRARERVSALPIVELVRPRAAPNQETLQIPGDIRANRSTAIFARATGYLKPPPEGIDIGARVRAGQVIAEISAPDVDAQLAQASAALNQARAALVRAEQENEVSRSTLRRYENAVAANAVSAQEIDERRAQSAVTSAAVDEARASIAVAESEVRRLTELQGFTRIVAPFDGVITSRTYDTGALISGTDGAPGRELFRIAQTDIVRVNVSVPQRGAAAVVIGRPADIEIASFPGRTFRGTIARTAGAIDPASRTLRVEVDVPNEAGDLLPGMYATVKLSLPVTRPSLIVPVSSVLSDAEGVRVAVVENNRIRYRAVTLGRDLGSEMEIVSGLDAEDRVVKDPGRRPEGTEVTIAQPATPKA